MIRFIAPAALAGLVLALGPLLIHLLQRRQARRVVVPTVRFVPPVSHSSLRLRAPDDVLLLLLRTAVIVLAVLALAGPVVLTDARTAAWNERVVRAVVVDTSASAAAGRAEAVLSQASAGAYASRRFESERLRDALSRAGSWLETAPPGRREVVVVSDFQAGSLSDADLTVLPDGIGVRFERSGTSTKVDLAERGVEYYSGAPHHREVTLDGWTTALTLSRATESGPALRIEGASAEQAARLERLVRDAGVAASTAKGKVVVRFGTADDQPETKAEGPAAAALLRLATAATGHTGNTEKAATANTGHTGNTEKAATAATEHAGNTEKAATADTEHTGIGQNRTTLQLGGALFTARADGDTLIVTTAADPDSFEAAQLVHAAVAAWRDPQAYAETETQTIGDETLKAWTRDAAPADQNAWRQVDSTDARWFWGLALLCLGAEWILRRRIPAEREHHARAA